MCSDGPSRVRFRLLGPLQVTVDASPVRLGGIGSRAVLAMLLTAGGRTVTESALIDALWGTDPPPSARNSLQSHVSRLRQRLVDAGGAGLGDRLRHHPGGYRLQVESDEVDVARVEALLARAREARSSDPAATDLIITLLTEASACWHGPPLADLAELPGWDGSGLAASRARLDELELTIGEELLQARLTAGADAVALPDLEGAVTAQPLRERPHRMLALALYRCDRVTDALAVLRRYRQRLVDEAGLDPSPELADLERAILTADPALALPAAPAPAEFAIPVRDRPPAEELIGREHELERLLDLARTAADGRGGVALVAGEPGIGKTRLLSALATAFVDGGGLVLSGRCLDGAGAVPYHPIAEAVRELLAAGFTPQPADLTAIATLVPGAISEGNQAPQPQLKPDELRLRLLDGFARFLVSLTRTRPVLVVVDDLQWADPSTIAMLRHIARYTGGHRLVLVGAYRSEEVPDAHPLWDALAGLRSDAEYLSVPLTGLSVAAIDRLLLTMMEAQLAPPVVEAIATETGGNPLFAREMVRHLIEENALDAGPDALLRAELPLRAVPEGVRQVIARRRRRLSAVANRLLDAAAAVDGPFPFGPVADVAGMDVGSALAGLDEALQAGLVTAGVVPDHYDFAHALMRHTVYNSLNPSRRLRLHRRLAEAFVAARTAGMQIAPSEIAVQYHRSRALPGAESGVEPALQAAARARAAGAHEEDAALLQLADELARPDDPRRGEMLTRCAVAQAWSLSFDRAVDTAWAAMETVAAAAGPAAAADTAAELAATLSAAGSNRHAWELAPRGLALADGPDGADPATRAALTLLDLDRREAADPENPGIPLELPERRGALQILHEAGLLVGRADLGRYATAAVYGSRGRVPAEAAEDPTVALLLLGDFVGALPRFEAAAAAAHDSGQLAWELYCRSGITRCHTALGDLGAAGSAMTAADDLADRAFGDTASWQLITHLGARDALAMALDTGWDAVLTASLPLLETGLPEHRWATATVAAACARCHARSGAPQDALSLLPHPVQALQRAPIWAPNYLRTACDVVETLWLLDERSDLDAVRGPLERALRADFRFPMMDARLGLARLAVLDGTIDEARRWFEESRRVLEVQSARPLRAIVDHDEARMHRRLGDHDQAHRLASAADKQFAMLGMHGWRMRLGRLT